MVKENPYYIPKENIYKTEEVIYLKNEIPTYEEFLKNYKVDERVTASYWSEIHSQIRGYGPCKNSDCDCYCSAYECICNNYDRYGGGLTDKNARLVKIKGKTVKIGDNSLKVKGFQHLIHTGNDWSDRNGGPSTSRNELWDGNAAINVNDEVGLHSIRSSAGVNAGLGGVIASAGADYSFTRIGDGRNEVNFGNASAGAEAGFGPGGVTAGYTLSADAVNLKVGGLRANAGGDLSSGVSIGAGGIEAKVGGVGFSLGKKVGISTPVGGISFDFEDGYNNQ